MADKKKPPLDQNDDKGAEKRFKSAWPFDVVPLSNEGRDAASANSTTGDGLDMTLDEKVRRMHEQGGPRKSNERGGGSFGQSDAEKRRLQDESDLKRLKVLRAQALRRALENR